MNRPEICWPKKPTTWIENRVLHVSIPFTWNLPSVRSMLMQMNMGWENAIVGGPATALMPEWFDGMDWVTVGTSYPGVLQRIQPLATRTTTGCPNRCAFCGVPRFEPTWAELPDWYDAPILCDNNLTKASAAHFDKVMDRLDRWGWCDFNQGLDCRLLNAHHAERIGRIKGAIVRLALDNAAQQDAWSRAAALLISKGTAKGRIRSYVLCGFGSGPEDAWGRCRFVQSHGAMPLPQWYHALNALKFNAITKEQKEHGWNSANRNELMHHFYPHT